VLIRLLCGEWCVRYVKAELLRPRHRLLAQLRVVMVEQYVETDCYPSLFGTHYNSALLSLALSVAFVAQLTFGTACTKNPNLRMKCYSCFFWHAINISTAKHDSFSYSVCFSFALQPSSTFTSCLQAIRHLHGFVKMTSCMWPATGSSLAVGSIIAFSDAA